jgi:hypothetical protein
MLNKSWLRLFIALTVVVVALLAFHARTASSTVAPDVRAAFAFDTRFPGKAQDDLLANIDYTIGVQSARAFPGKEQDDLVNAGTNVDNQFPGKEQDDLAVASSAPGSQGGLIEDRADRALRTGMTPERVFPGKEKDDMVVP